MLAAILCAAACNRNIEPFVEGEQPREADLARIFPDGADAPPPGGGQIMGMGGSPRTAEAGGGSGATGAASASAEGGDISGTIRLKAGASTPAGATLFVIARAAGTAGGPPLAVLRIPEPSFPVAYAIGPDNVMIPSMKFTGSIQLTARLDSDGNAMTRAETDLAGSAPAPHPPGTPNVDLSLE